MVNLTTMQILIQREQRLKRKQVRAYENATNITTVLTGMPRGGSGNQSQVENGAIELAEVENAYREVFFSLEKMRKELDELLVNLEDPDDIGIMRLRYIEGHHPEEILEMVNLSRRAMFYHLSGAERKLMQMFPDKVIRTDMSRREKFALNCTIGT